MDKKFSLIKQLDTTTTKTKLIIRVMRLWKVVNLYTNVKVSFDMILMDEEGDQIHASIRHDLFKSVSDIIQEGATLNVEDFKIEDKAKSFRPIDYKYKVTFDENTIIKPTEEELLFPPPKFVFLDFKDIPSKWNNKADLIDVIGFWCKSGETKSKNTKMGTTYLKDIHITDNDGNMLRIAFWGDAVEQVPNDIILDVKPQNVIIVTSTYVGTFEGEYYLQCTQATKTYVNLDIAEVTSFRNKGSKPSSEKLTPTRKRINVNLEKKEVDDKKTIQEILAAVTDGSSKDFYSCIATITGLHKSRGWYYISCQNCLKVVKKKEKKGYYCFNCKDVVEHVERYKIQFEIEDDTGVMDVTVFTDIAEELIGHSFDSMIDVVNEGVGEEAVLDMIEEKIVGKQKIFNLKISNYNRQNPMSALTAAKIMTTRDDSKRAKQVKIED